MGTGPLSFAQWEEQAARRAALLAELGVAPGQHVATLFSNGPQALAVFHALWKLGAVLVPLNNRLRPPSWPSSSTTARPAR